VIGLPGSAGGCRLRINSQNDGDAASLHETRTLPRISGFAGILGPILFISVFTVLGQVTPGYSPITDVISNLELGQIGWIQQLNFLQMGSLIIVFALGFRKAMMGVIQRRLTLPSVLFVLSGLGMIDAALFTPAYPVEHVIGGFILFIFPLLIAIFLIGRVFLRARLRSLGLYSLTVGFLVLLMLLYFFFGLGLSAPTGEAPKGLTGVVNRAFVVLALSWFLAVGIWLVRGRGQKPDVAVGQIHTSKR